MVWEQKKYNSKLSAHGLLLRQNFPLKPPNATTWAPKTNHPFACHTHPAPLNMVLRISVQKWIGWWQGGVYFYSRQNNCILEKSPGTAFLLFSSPKIEHMEKQLTVIVPNASGEEGLTQACKRGDLFRYDNDILQHFNQGYRIHDYSVLDVHHSHSTASPETVVRVIMRK